MCGYSWCTQIDVGVYIVASSNLRKRMGETGQKWEDSLSSEKVRQYLPYSKSAIHVPIFVLGLDE